MSLKTSPVQKALFLNAIKFSYTASRGIHYRGATLATTEVVQQIIDVFNGQPARYAVNAPFLKAEAMPFPCSVP
jgi:hypothetical protein